MFEVTHVMLIFTMLGLATFDLSGWKQSHYKNTKLLAWGLLETTAGILATISLMGHLNG